MDMHRNAWKPALAALAIAIVAPTSGAAQELEQKEEVREEAAPTVTVANYNWLDVHVYIARATGGRTSLGLVTSQQTRSFDLPRGFTAGATDIRIIADPIGSGRAYVSPAFFPEPGTDFHLEIQASLGLSSASQRTGLAGR
jgi:hypothetical protein